MDFLAPARSLLALLYPHTCAGCGTDTLRSEEFLCHRCIDDLPYTSFENYALNPVERLFIGRLQFEAAVAGFYFVKGGLLQHLIHELKYKGNKQAGLWLAQKTGERLLLSGRFSGIDGVVSLPMDEKKQHKRGYNQADIIAEGIGEAMNIPVLARAVIRSRATETQTRKHRMARWENAADSFLIPDPAAIAGKHLLLVDDVLTTGATLEACARIIQEAAPVKISIVTLALAGK